MTRSPMVARKVRQKGNWVAVGDSLQSGFGGAVPWSTQANGFWWPDTVVMHNLGVAGQVVGPSSDSTSMLAHIGDATALFDGSKNYNIASIWGGANDIQAGRNATDIYTDLTTWRNTMHAAGFLTLCYCVVRMNKPAPFLATRAALNTSILGNAAGFDAVISFDSIPGTPGDGGNYNPDGIHLTTAGQTVALDAGNALNLILPHWKPLVGL